MPHPQSRKWLILAWAGFALILLAIATVCLVIFDKEHFSWLVGPAFVGSVVGMVAAGSIALMVAAAFLRPGKTWRTFAVVAWSVLALISPLFGLLFLFPWGVLLITAPVIITILLNWSRLSAAVAA